VILLGFACREGDGKRDGEQLVWYET